MQQHSTGNLSELLAAHEPPCVSLYLPTHRAHPENQQDPIRFRNLLKEMETSLSQKYPTREVRPILEKFQALARGDRFWNHRTDTLGSELTEPHETVASCGKGIGSGGAAMHHGHGAKPDEVDIDRDRFFRVVDRRILEHHTRSSGLPLLLAALPEHHAPFRAISHNTQLVANGLKANPEALSLGELRAEAWKVFEPAYQQRLAKLVDDYRVAQSRQLGSDDLTQVAQAALSGRVGVLLVEANRMIPGRLESASVPTESGQLTHPGIDDMLDDLAEAVLRTKSTVIVVPAEQMPTDTGLAATYRF